MISVIVPVYNVTEYLDRAVEAIVAQTYRDLEIILVDDGSTDESGDMCEKWAKKDSRIKVLHKANGGLSSARNAGMDIATGEFFTFPDSDDFIDSDYLEKMVAQMADPNVTMVCCGFKITDLAGRETIAASSEMLRLSKAEAIGDIFTFKNNVRPSACNKLYRRELFDGLRFNENVVQEDTEAMPRILDRGGDVCVINDTFYHYIKRDGSISMASKFSMKSYRFLECMPEYNRMCRNKYKELYPEFQYYLLSNHYGILNSLIKSSDSRKYLWQELVLRAKCIAFYMRARKYKVNVDKHGPDMKAMFIRSAIGLRLAAKLFS